MTPKLLVCLLLVAAPSALAQGSKPGQPATGGKPRQTQAHAALAPAQALELVRSFYPVAPMSEPPFTARLMKLYTAAIANSRRIDAPVAGIDFAFQVNAQDTDNDYQKSLKILPRRFDGKHAFVRVSLRNYRPVELLFDLVFENGKWAVDEVRSLREPRWTLSKLYAAGAKEK